MSHQCNFDPRIKVVDLGIRTCPDRRGGQAAFLLTAWFLLWTRSRPLAHGFRVQRVPVPFILLRLPYPIISHVFKNSDRFGLSALEPDTLEGYVYLLVRVAWSTVAAPHQPKQFRV